MAVLNILSTAVNQPKGVWETLLRAFSFIPDYAWRIIAFTILLKLVLLPLDFFQKYKMKKNQRITEALAPEMEKLQKQYGDDKTTYHQQMMKLQRGAGFSYFSACIPMIVTLVIFFTFFAGMRNISAYNEFKQYVDRFDVYAEEYYNLTGLPFVEGLDYENEPSRLSEFDATIVTWGQGLSQNSADELAAYDAYLQDGKASGGQGVTFSAFYQNYLNRYDERNFYVNSIKILEILDSEQYQINIKNSNGTYNLNNLYNYCINYQSSTQAVKDECEKAANIVIDKINQAIAALAPQHSLIQKDAGGAYITFTQFHKDLTHTGKLGSTYVPIIFKLAENQAASAVYDYYVNNQPKFLWIKSIWIADVPWSDSVLSYSKFKTNVSKYMGKSNEGKLPSAVHNEISKEDTYNKVMFKIRQDEKLSKTNGYLLLAVLAVGLAFLSQIISTRQQKRSGQAATAGGTFKMMMYVMPIMIGVFAIFSTSAFTLYMITNSFMTLMINLLTSGVLAIMGFGGTKKEKNESGVIRYGRKDPNDK